MPASAYVASSLTELVTIRARDQPNDIAIYTGIDEPGDLLRPLTYALLDRILSSRSNLSGLGLLAPVGEDGIPPQRNIAVLTSSAIDESLLEIALAKLGLTPLLLSVNNSIPAVAHLCKITQSTHLIYGSRFTVEAEEARKLLAEQGYSLEIVPDKRFPLWGSGGVEKASIKPFLPVLQPKDEKSRNAVILHSSGSTGFPKPVYITHFAFIANIAPFVTKTGFSALPVFHGFGHYSVFRCFYAGRPFVLYPAHIPLTAANICRVIRAIPVPCPLCFAVPYVIKLMGDTEEGTKALASFESVTFSGAAVPDDLGDRLTAAGVNLNAIYGTTETGSLLRSTRDYAADKAWNWLRLEGPIVDYLVMEGRGSSTYESVVFDGWPAKIQSNRPDGSYATKDLFIQHPEHSNWYKYIGRLDDTIVQVLGEKTNPVPIELAIRGNSPYVDEAIVFGVGRPQVGALILPSEFAKDLSKDHKAFLEKIWPVIEEANAQAPTHSRILPEMVHILDYGTQIPQATKLSILRPACYNKFKDIIDAIYERFENGSGTTKLDLSQSELEDFLLNAITQTLGAHKAAKLTKTTDLFAFGVDSLQSTRIRNICQKELGLNGHSLGQNVVYENPSIEKLAAYITIVRSGGDTAVSVEQQHAAMYAMVDKWSTKFDVQQPQAQNHHALESAGLNVVLTGATGSLGAHILYQLLSLPAVSRVICLSRAKSHSDSLSRLKESVRTRRLVLSEKQWTRVESYATNVNEDKLGLTPEEYAHVLSETSAVIHNAWPVNFNMTVDSYDEHIGGVLNLINLCLRSSKAQRPSFFFSSSVAACAAQTDPVCKEDFPPSPTTAIANGYGRSKWIAEKLCERAATDTRLHVGVLRLGQLVGDTEKGVWNETEAWPLMFKSAQATGVLPQLGERLQWLPVDVTGRAVVEIVTQPQSPKSAVYHVLNPVPSGWDAVLAGLKQGGLEFNAVDLSEWLERLAKSNPDAEKNPAIKLLPYYRNRFSKLNSRVSIDFRVDETIKVAPSIAKASAISPELACKWVNHWREVGFLSS